MKKTTLLVMLFSVICLLVACSEKDIDLATGTPGTSEPDASTPETQAFTLNTTQQTSNPINTVSDSTPTDTPTDSTQTQPLTAPSDSPTPSVPVHQLSPAEKYLAETSEEDIFEYFLRATEVRYGKISNIFGFKSPEEISSFQLYRFAIIVSTKAIPDIDSNWYNENDKKFYVPLSDITDILDIHFDNYSFIPTEVGHDYNEETSEFEGTALGFGSGAAKLTFFSASAVDDFTIEVIIIDDFVPEPYDDFGPLPDILVRAKVDDNGVKFTYCGFMNNSK